MKKLNQFAHNLAGKEIICDYGNWSCSGRWSEEIYRVNGDSSIQHVRTQHYWNNVTGKAETESGDAFIPSCDGESVFIGGTRCKLPLGTRFEPLPEHTCQEPLFHDYVYSVDGKRYQERYGFCSISTAKNKWLEFVASYPQHTFNLLSVTRSL